VAASVADAIKAASSKIGAPYVWGAEGPSTFDCSGLMVWAWNKAGVQLPRTSQAQAKFGKPVSPKNIKPGDLVTSNWGGGPSSHVGMYMGGGKIIHAPRPGKGVTLAKLDENYRSKVDAIRRIPGVSYSGVDKADFELPIPGEIWEWEKGWSEKLLEGDLGGALSDIGEGVLGLNKDALTAPFTMMADQLLTIGKATLSVGHVAEFLLKLALPSTWVRIMCGALGTLVLFLGLFFLVREARGATA
jgi:hypothetical protein